MTLQEWATVVGVSGIVSGAVSAGLGLLRDKAFLGAQFKHDQRKKLRELIGEYHGRMLEAALDWDRRMGQLYDRAARGEEGARWHELAPGPQKRFAPEQYVYQSLVFRFLCLMALARRFEVEAFFIRLEVAGERDFDFLRYTKGFLWSAIHPEITPNDGLPGLDHFRSDSFRPVLDYCYARRDGLPETLSREDRLIFDWERFHAIVEKLNLGEPEQASTDSVARAFMEVFAFFDGLCSHSDTRRRWDRLVALHLFVLAFIATFGYSWQRRDLREKSEAAVSQLRDPSVLQGVFDQWLPNLGFESEDSRVRSRSAQNKMRVIRSALAERVLPVVQGDRA
jgi:hypothetical protein